MLMKELTVTYNEFYKTSWLFKFVCKTSLLEALFKTIEKIIFLQFPKKAIYLRRQLKSSVRWKQIAKAKNFVASNFNLDKFFPHPNKKISYRKCPCMTTGWRCYPVINFFQMTTRWGCHPVIILIWKWKPDGTSIRLSFEQKWQPDDLFIRLSIFFKWQPDGAVILLSYKGNCGMKFFY